MAFIEGCPHVGVAFIEGCPHVGVAFIEGCPHVGVAFIEGCPHVRGGLYEGFHCRPKGWPVQLTCISQIPVAPSIIPSYT